MLLRNSPINSGASSPHGADALGTDDVEACGSTATRRGELMRRCFVSRVGGATAAGRRCRTAHRPPSMRRTAIKAVRWRILLHRISWSAYGRRTGPSNATKPRFSTWQQRVWPAGKQVAAARRGAAHLPAITRYQDKRAQYRPYL